MENEDFLYIEDDNKRKLYYRFTPAAIASNFMPLIVVLDEGGSTEPTHFEHKMWNVLTPLDNFGYKNSGSCWLGEKGDFFVKDLLQKLIHEIAEAHECEEHIYLYGSSMGGYGAILHGILCKANAVYAHATQIRLQETQHTNTEMKQFYNSIFDKMTPKEKDLTHFLNPSDPFPVFYLSKGSTVDENCPEDDTAYFVAACKKHDIKVHLDFCPKLNDNGIQAVKEVLNFFERIASEG
ncbi:MAG: hypothetical protein KJO45_02455 [Sulfurovum sp.]|nr:hypothetical protein [Sulfurovum sp.]